MFEQVGRGLAVCKHQEPCKSQAYLDKTNWFSYFSTKTCVVGTQKNPLIETVLLSTQNKCWIWWIRKYSQLYTLNCFVSLKPN